jgi:ribosomal protein S1
VTGIEYGIEMSEIMESDDPASVHVREEREPQLKYEHLEQDVQGILANTRITCLSSSEKILVLGTEKGTVHILDISGNEVRSVSAYSRSLSCRL